MVVNKDTLIGDILDFDVQCAKFFFEIGMHCLGCPHSRGESIEEACAVHGTDADELVKKTTLDELRNAVVAYDAKDLFDSEYTTAVKSNSPL